MIDFMKNMITCKINNKECHIMMWQDFNIIDYKVFDENIIQQIEQFTDTKHSLTVYDIIYFDEMDEYRDFLSGAIRINIHRVPFKKENYKNLKHQLYFYLIKYISSGKIKIKCNIDKTQLKIELDQAKKHKFDTDDRLQIQPRQKIIENIGHDISIVDCMSYRMFAVLKGIG